MTTFITRTELGPGPGPMLAVKDIIDLIGLPTTAGSRPVAEVAAPAAADAACMAGARAAGARIVGKANLFELAYGASGVNEWFGTPTNPLDPTLVPGGSSSGSAVAVATGEAEIAYGSDTGGSIRIPSAFCGTTGLKTTFGRIPLEGVWPLAASLDTIGPMARDVAGVALGMRLLEPGSAPAGVPARAIGRLRLPGVAVDPAIDTAVDRLLAAAEVDVVELVVPEWLTAYHSASAILASEAETANRELLDDPVRRAQLGAMVAARFRAAAGVTADEVGAARAFRSVWQRLLADLFERVELLALPTVAFLPPRLDEAANARYTELTNPVNLAGLPALALPAPTGGRLPAGLQLVGPWGREDLLLATGATVEAAGASLT
ncbi:MAG: amidase [Ilumatobacteraceae bacterium]